MYTMSDTEGESMRMYRTATHPDFLAYVVEPALVEAGLTTEIAPVVAQMMDAFGCSAAEAIRNIRVALVQVVDSTHA